MTTCDVCDDVICSPQDAGDFTTGWVKDDREDSFDYEPNGDEWFLCFECAEEIRDHLKLMKRMKHS